MRSLLIALFATAALPAAALAQDMERRAGAAASIEAQAGPRTGGWRNGGGFGAPRADAPPRAERGWRGDAAQARPNRAWSGDAQPRPAPGWTGGDDRGRRFDRAPEPRPVPAQVASPPQDAARDAGRRNWGRRNWGGNVQRPDDGRADRWNRAGEGRRDNDARPGWNRGDGGRGDMDRADAGRRDWNRGDNDRREWNRGQGARDWNGRGWTDNRRDARGWDRNWRNDTRYDWQRYRTANRSAYRQPRYAAPYGWNYGYRRQSIGAYLFAGLFARDYWIADPWAYRLPPVSWPYQWVRYYDDALLVDTRSGYVVDSIPDIFW